MNKKLKIYIVRFLYVFMPLIAVVILGASSYMWYKALVPETDRISLIQPFQVSPDAFSYGLEGNLLRILKDFGIGDESIKIRKAESFQDDIQRIYTITIPENASLILFNLRITKMTGKMGGHVFRGLEGSGGRTLTLTLGVGKTPTDVVILRKARGIIAKTVKVAVIIDDLGIKSLSLTKRLCNLEQVLTLAILPFQKNTSRVVELAGETEIPYILHMPMEPKSGKSNPGEGAIFTGDNVTTVEKKLNRAFKSVSGAKGLNNHMGSKTTEDTRTMENVMSFLRKNDYFFVDSQTSRNSKGYEISQKSGVRGTVVSGYIDVKDEKAAIEKRLDELARYAFENGSVVILGHDRPNTIEVLEKKLPELEKKGIKFVRISDLIH